MGQKEIASYDKDGNASHYDRNRMDMMRVAEQTYGTIGAMYFCEINILKYRLRMGHKQGQELEIEMTKVRWYEKAAKYYFDKSQSEDNIPGLDNLDPTQINRKPLPWLEE